MVRFANIEYERNNECDTNTGHITISGFSEVVPEDSRL